MDIFKPYKSFTCGGEWVLYLRIVSSSLALAVTIQKPLFYRIDRVDGSHGLRILNGRTEAPSNMSESFESAARVFAGEDG